MELTGNTILITGGGSGIGFAFAERFIKSGNTVIICGRREEKLKEAKEKYPNIHTRACDITVEKERQDLVEWALSEFPNLNVVVNNAGIQQRFKLLEGTDKSWDYYAKEISINVEAPIHLTMLLLPHLSKQDKSAVINVTSGLAFTPMAPAPIYSATKAAMHSFTMSLRFQTKETPVEVIEVAPPAVNTDLGGVGLHTFGAPLDDFADAIFEGFNRGDIEIGYGTAEKALRMTRDEIDEHFERMNSRF